MNAIENRGHQREFAEQTEYAQMIVLSFSEMIAETEQFYYNLLLTMKVKPSVCVSICTVTVAICR